MTLDEWLKDQGLTAAEFSQNSGVPEPDVSKYRRGLHFPRPETLAKIFKATGGSVTANDFFPEEVLSNDS